MPKIRKWKPYTKRWETEANAIARAQVDIQPCERCGYPVVTSVNRSGLCRTCLQDGTRPVEGVSSVDQ